MKYASSAAIIADTVALTLAAGLPETTVLIINAQTDQFGIASLDSLGYLVINYSSSAKSLYLPDNGSGYVQSTVPVTGLIINDFETGADYAIAALKVDQYDIAKLGQIFTMQLVSAAGEANAFSISFSRSSLYGQSLGVNKIYSIIVPPMVANVPYDITFKVDSLVSIAANNYDNQNILYVDATALANLTINQLNIHSVTVEGVSNVNPHS